MKVAVVGSGVSGLGATWLLNEHSEHEVHLYEADDRPGGHANTVKFTPPKGSNFEPVDVDTGFIVFNPSTYPNFLRFLRLYPSLAKRILPTEMTFSVSRDAGAFEWAGTGDPTTAFAQPWRVLDPRQWRLIYDVLRFNSCARRLVLDGSSGREKKPEAFEQLSIGEYIEREGYSAAFRDNYLIPMTAAIWSTPPDKCFLDFPARTLVQFMSNHHLLQLLGKPAWLTLHGGSRTYVDSILSRLPKSQLHLSSAVTALSSEPGGQVEVTFCTPSGEPRTETYDHVVLATHSDTALRILGYGATETEKRILGRVRWNRNEAVLHSDLKLMPRRRKAWACWNYLTESAVGEKGVRRPKKDQVALTYCMNQLQHLPESKHGPVLVTLNPPFEASEEAFVGRYKYDHPVIDANAVLSQREIHEIQGTRGITYAGAWLNYGFHEDGFTAGLRAVSRHLPGVRPPFDIRDADRAPPSARLLGVFFDLFELTGARALVGALLAFALAWVRSFVGRVVDLRQLEGELRSENGRATVVKPGL